MNDKEELIKLYHDMYAAMVAKDEEKLRRVHDDSFVLIHMTGMNQSKEEYIRAIMNGTLNYFSDVPSGKRIILVIMWKNSHRS